jgi:hypothetical protein
MDAFERFVCVAAVNGAAMVYWHRFYQIAKQALKANVIGIK